MKNSLRRSLLKHGLFAGLVGACYATMNRAVAEKLFTATPEEIEGPFYPVTHLSDQDHDLTRIHGKAGMAQGKHILVTGAVIDKQGRPIEQARVEIWQANAAGRYRHLYDPNPAPIDPNFQGYAVVSTDVDGVFLFKTVIPGAYPASKHWVRPPHIHFKVSHQGYSQLITQMYFPGNPLNASDLLLNDKSSRERKLMIAQKKASSGDLEVYEYFIVLRETEIDQSIETGGTQN